jgi:hypothetical protein
LDRIFVPFCMAHKNAGRNVAVRLAVYQLRATIALGYGFDDPGFDFWQRQKDVKFFTRLYLLPKLVLSGAVPPLPCLVIVLFIDYGLFNRTVETSGPVPAVRCLSCTTTTPSRSIEPGAFCPGAVWLDLSGEHATSMLNNCTKRQLNLLFFVHPSICLSICPSLSYNSLTLDTFL